MIALHGCALYVAVDTPTQVLLIIAKCIQCDDEMVNGEARHLGQKAILFPERPES